MSEEEKWAANIAFVGKEKTVKKILKKLSKLDENGEIEDYTKIDGPFDSLQLMLKRRKENLALEVSNNADANKEEINELNEENKENEEDENLWFEVDDEDEDEQT